MGNGLTKAVGPFPMVEGIHPYQAAIEPNLGVGASGGDAVAERAEIIVFVASWDRCEKRKSHGFESKKIQMAVQRENVEELISGALYIARSKIEVGRTEQKRCHNTPTHQTPETPKILLKYETICRVGNASISKIHATIT
jgi:hypothetical protein